jgi:hypothetical protein
MHRHTSWLPRVMIFLTLISLAATITAVPQSSAGSTRQQRMMGGGPGATPVLPSVPGGVAVAPRGEDVVLCSLYIP